MRFRGLPLIQTTVERIRDLIEGEFKLVCACCYDSKAYREFIKICSNPNCIFDICKDCVQKVHPFHIGNATDDDVFHGLISKNQCSCLGCTCEINPKNKQPNAGLMRFLFEKNFFVAKNGEEYQTHASACLNGVKLWRCSNGVQCPNLRNKDACHGVFEVEKQACAVGLEEKDEPHFCGTCVKIKMEQARLEYEAAQAKLHNLPSEQDAYGFFIIDGMRVVKCPNCKTPIVRAGKGDETEGCAHMTCKCGQHFCYCCSEAFENGDLTMKHVKSLFGTMFPEDEAIERRALGRILQENDVAYHFDNHGSDDDGADDDGTDDDDN
jgi:predicted peroxiredoxin